MVHYYYQPLKDLEEEIARQKKIISAERAAAKLEHESIAKTQ